MTDNLPRDAQGVVDFTLPMEPKRFRIDDDVFSAPAIVSPIKLARLAAAGKSLGELDMSTPEAAEKSIADVADLFATFIGGRDGAHFAARLRSLGEEGDLQPIDLQQQALPALMYLLEAYGMRPTSQSSLSSPNATTGDSTDGAPLAASTGAE